MAAYVLVYCSSQRSDDVLLVLKDKPKWQVGRLNLPGGKIEAGETPLEAGARELKEETGYVPLVPMRVMGLLQDGSTKIFCMKAAVHAGLVPCPDEKETQSIAWHSWHEVRSDERLIPNLTVIIPLIRCGVTGWIIGDTYRGHDKPRHTIKISLSSGGLYYQA